MNNEDFHHGAAAAINNYLDAGPQAIGEEVEMPVIRFLKADGTIYPMVDDIVF